MTAPAPAKIRPPRERLAIAARAIEPILNRVVLAGPPVVDFLMNDPGVRTAGLQFAEDATLRLLSTSMVDRIGADLQKLGFSRIARTATADRWRLSDDIAVDLVQVRADDKEPDQILLEYATLLTLSLKLDGPLTIRITGAPASLAIELAAYTRSGAGLLDSEELERAVLLIAGRTEIEKEYAAAPAELRAAIAAPLARLAASDALELIVQRALPDAALLPALVTRVRDRLRRMAA